MLIWLRRLWPFGLAASLLIGIYLIFPPFGNEQAGQNSKAGLEAFISHNSPKPIADLRFMDENGQEVSLGDFQGKVILLNVWATWCAPCRKEMPDLAELQQNLGGSDFAVIAVSIDRKGAEVAKPFLKEVGAESLALYTDISSRIVTDLKSPGLPTTLLIDREGQEIGRLMGPADWAAPEAFALIQSAISR